MPWLRYIGESEGELIRHNGMAVTMKTGTEIDLTDEEAKGCACRPERKDGNWERVEKQGAKGKEKS